MQFRRHLLTVVVGIGIGLSGVSERRRTTGIRVAGARALPRHPARHHEPRARFRRPVVRCRGLVRDSARHGHRRRRSRRPPQRRDRGSRERPAQCRRAGRIHLRGRHSQAGRHRQGQWRPGVRDQQPRPQHRARLLPRGGARLRGRKAGNAFLMDQGYTYVSSGWLHGAPGAGSPRPVLATLPLAMDDGRAITGASMEEWQDPDSAAFGRLTYPTVSLEKTAATLTHRQLQNDPRQTVPAGEWDYVDDMTVAVARPAGTDAGTIYEFVYEARNPIVHGLGFGAMARFSCRSPATVPPTIGASRTRSSWTVLRCSTTRWPSVHRRAAGWPGTSSTRVSTRTRRGGAFSTA